MLETSNKIKITPSKKKINKMSKIKMEMMNKAVKMCLTMRKERKRKKKKTRISQNNNKKKKNRKTR